jgi:peptide/nickel transport system permease protein
MGRYVIRRLLWTILVVLVVTLLTFVIFFLMPPGNPAVRFAGKQPTPELIAEVEKNLGLDKPAFGIEVPRIWESRPWNSQYGFFLKRLFLGDGTECPKLLAWTVCHIGPVENFVVADQPGCAPGVSGCGWPGLGMSYDSRTSVREELIDRTPRTLSLIIGAAFFWLVVGVSIGVVSALKRRTIWDRLAMGFALFGISAPVFWLGLIALYIFSNTLEINALGTGYVEFHKDPWGWGTHLLMPWVVLALLYAAFYARMTRGNLIDVMGEDYIRTARAKGLPERKVIFKHGLRASLTPIVTIFGMDIALLVGGAVITETVFNIQGLGNFTVQAAQGADLPAVTGVVIVAAFAVAFMNLLVDLAYAYLDPRVRYS